VPTPPPCLHRMHSGPERGGDEHPLRVGLTALPIRNNNTFSLNLVYK
jgi:hypothetical protein